MRSNNIGCFGMILVTAAIIGAITAFTNGNVGLGWFFAIAAFVLPLPIGNAMLRANTREHDALSGSGEVAARELARAAEARSSHNPMLAEEHWESAMKTIPGMRRHDDWTGLMLVYLLRYSTLRADHQDIQAAALMSAWRTEVLAAPELFRYKFLLLLSRAEALSHDVHSRLIEERIEFEEVFGDILDL